MNTYKKYASIIQLLSLIIICSHSILTIIHWFFPTIYTYIQQEMACSVTRQYDTTAFSLGQRLSGFFVESVASIILIYGLYLVMQLMHSIKKNHCFTLEAITLFTRITKIACIYVVYNMLCTTMLSIITSFHNAPGERIIMVRFGYADVMNLLVFCFMFLIMTIFQKGYELQHEQELTI